RHFPAYRRASFSFPGQIVRLRHLDSSYNRNIPHPLMKNIITPSLWFDHQAEEAANFYISIFRNSKITAITRYGVAGQEHHRRPPGSVMVVAFELDGQPFTALNGGPVFKFTEAVSLQIGCETQEEVDYFWDN